MKGPSPELLARLERGERIPCPLTHSGDAPDAHFYCSQCGEVRCGWHSVAGFCLVCRALVRSTGALLLAIKEKHGN